MRSVEVELTTSYRAPEKHTISVPERDDARNAVTGRRRYDGVELLDEPKSVFIGGRWELRRNRELSEPAPVRTAALIDRSAAPQSAEVTNAETRLV